MAGLEFLDCSEKYLLAGMDISIADFEVGRTPILEGAVSTEAGTGRSVGVAFGRNYSPDWALEVVAWVGLSIETTAGSSQTWITTPRFATAVIAANFDSASKRPPRLPAITISIEWWASRGHLGLQFCWAPRGWVKVAAWVVVPQLGCWGTLLADSFKADWKLIARRLN